MISSSYKSPRSGQRIHLTEFFLVQHLSLPELEIPQEAVGKESNSLPKGRLKIPHPRDIGINLCLSMCISYGISLCLCVIRIYLFCLFTFAKIPDNNI